MLFQTVFHGNMSHIIQIRSDIFLRLGNLPIRDQCNTGIILTNRGILLVDFPAQQPKDEIISEVEALFCKKVTHLFLTHAHGDHCNGLSEMENEEILLLCSKETYKELRICYPLLNNPIRVLHDKECFQIENKHFFVQIPEQLPAHSPWDMLIQYCEANLLFTGDFLNPPDTLYFHSSYYRNWICEARSMLKQTSDETILVPGHGMPWTPARAEVSLSHLTGLAKIYEKLLDKKISGDSITQIEKLYELLPDESDLIYSLTQAASDKHVIRQLREITSSMQTIPKS